MKNIKYHTVGTVQIFNIKIVKKYKVIEGNHNVGKVKIDQAWGILKGNLN